MEFQRNSEIVFPEPANSGQSVNRVPQSIRLTIPGRFADESPAPLPGTDLNLSPLPLVRGLHVDSTGVIRYFPVMILPARAFPDR